MNHGSSKQTITMALAEPWGDTNSKTEPDPNTQTDGDGEGLTLTSTNTEGTETHTDVVIAPDMTGMDITVWGLWWPVHRYGFGTLFFMLCVYALYATVMRIFKNRAVGGGMRSRKSVQPVFTCINILVFLLGLSNTLMLFIDPYLFLRKFPLLLGVILINMPYPCMTSAFALVNWVLISISQMRMTRTSRLRSVWFLTGIIILHFLFIIGASLILVFIFPVLIIGIICHGFFVLWGVVLSLTYIYSAWKIMSTEKNNRKTLYDISVRDGSTVDGSIKTNAGSKISRTIPKRLSSIFSRNSKGPSINDTPVFSIGQNGNIHQPVTPMPSSILESEFESKFTTIDGVSDDISDPSTQEKIGEQDENKTETSLDKDKDQSGTLTKTESSPNGGLKKGNATGNDVSKSSNARQTRGNFSKSAPSASGKKGGKFDKQSGAKMSGTGRPQKSTQKVFRISAITAALGIAASGLGLYGILGLMIASAADQPTEWGWYVFQTCFRFVELGMGCTMAYFTTQPFPRRRQR
ncbi:uncharacterized protein LOC119744925 isoform X2 [Patiria miniata]|uniref:Proline-rich transmembrane protein 3/4 domain-containing protein n=1 Tax=Patiria miniata TaxID=46514 RepID=A0A914BL91_PATMI|nr:uncharacterized protein LOC119744925 isoform X2 [Patiria miniata]